MQSSVEIRNISATGAGMRIPNRLDGSEQVLLELPGGRALAAHVRWQRLGFAGLEFSTPLTPDDPLLVSPGGTGPEHQPPVPNGPGARISVFARWQRLDPARLDRRQRERACRKQGFAWLAD